MGISGWTRAGAAVLAAAIIGLMVGAARAEDTEQSLYEAAKKEGKVTFWSSDDVKVNMASAAEFTKRYPGVQVEAFKIEPGPALERIVTESSAGRLSTDVVDTPLVYMQQLLDRDLAVSYPWEKVFKIDPQSVLFDSKAVVYFNLDVPIVYNTGMVKAGEIKSWDDLTDPKWNGKVLIEARGTAFAILALDWGDDKTFDYLKKLMANNPIIIKGGTPTIEALAGGQGAIAIGTYGGRVIQYKEDGAPVEWAKVGPIPAMRYVATTMKASPHPNAAKLWIHWLTTPEHEKILYAGHHFGMLTGPNIDPLGKEMQDAGLKVVLESADTAGLQRRLEKAGTIIGALK